MTMPVLFLGHGSPMNAIETNAFTDSLRALVLPQPKAILVVSAHWVTRGTKVLSAAQPRTIHDFGGFPRALHEILYLAKGAPDLAQRITEKIPEVEADASWGLDHGTWSVLRHVFPEADIPVIQLSLAKKMELPEHVGLGRKLRFLRDEGVLIIGSGNVVHNLDELDFDAEVQPKDWALDFDQMIKAALTSWDLPKLLAVDRAKDSLWKRAHPTLEHYWPLLYVLGAADEQEEPQFIFEGIQNATIAMRSVRYG